jgi:hypothetical protein
MNEVNKFHQLLLQEVIALQAGWLAAKTATHRNRHLPALPLIFWLTRAKLKMQILPTMKKIRQDSIK